MLRCLKKSENTVLTWKIYFRLPLLKAAEQGERIDEEFLTEAKALESSGRLPQGNLTDVSANLQTKQYLKMIVNLDDKILFHQKKSGNT